METTAIVTFPAKIVRMKNARGLVDGPYVTYTVSVPAKRHEADTYLSAFIKIEDELNAHMAAPGHYTIRHFRGGMEVAH